MTVMLFCAIYKALFLYSVHSIEHISYYAEEEDLSTEDKLKAILRSIVLTEQAKLSWLSISKIENLFKMP